jgi:hypothetical protein
LNVSRLAPSIDTRRRESTRQGLLVEERAVGDDLGEHPVLREQVEELVPVRIHHRLADDGRDDHLDPREHGGGEPAQVLEREVEEAGRIVLRGPRARRRELAVRAAEVAVHRELEGDPERQRVEPAAPLALGALDGAGVRETQGLGFVGQGGGPGAGPSSEV